MGNVGNHPWFFRSFLVGGFNPSEKYESVGMIIPYIWENESHVPVTTNQFAIFPELKELTERDRS